MMRDRVLTVCEDDGYVDVWLVRHANKKGWETASNAPADAGQQSAIHAPIPAALAEAPEEPEDPDQLAAFDVVVQCTDGASKARLQSPLQSSPST